MPRKTKDVEEIKEIKTPLKEKNTTSTRKNTTTKKTSTKKAIVKYEKVKLDNTKKTTKKTTTKKTVSPSVDKKTNKEKKTTKKKTTSKVSDKKSDKKNAKSSVQIIEYYDLPYRYNQTIVKLLAQTPNTLFIYWDISDEDIEKYKETYGNNFLENTIPILIIHNETMNYSFEVEINDFANCWYLNVNDTKCNYSIELGRKPININNSNIPNNYLYISSSNKIESPNNHILFEKQQKMIYFRNVKNNDITSKEISNLSFIRNMGKIYNIYELYKKIYTDNELEDLNNPSS